MLPAGGSAQYYVEDLLGTSRVMTTNTGTLCYDADFYPYGGERPYTNSCPTSNNYKFEGKERDTETGNDDFGARYYSNFFGRWLSADWSSVPVAVPYANLTNPQTLNLYAMVSNDPETSADLDGHAGQNAPPVNAPGCQLMDCPGPSEMTLLAEDQHNQPAQSQQATQAAQQQAQGADNGRLSVDLKPNNPTSPNTIDIESGVTINGSITTSQRLSPGEASVSVNLYDNQDTGKHAPPGSIDIRVGQPENVTVKIGDQSTTQTRIPIQIMTAQSNQNFGFQGSGNLHFTVTDSQNNAFKGDHPATVSLPPGSGGGHPNTLVKDAGRTTFVVPQ